MQETEDIFKESQEVCEESQIQSQKVQNYQDQKQSIQNNQENPLKRMKSITWYQMKDAQKLKLINQQQASLIIQDPNAYSLLQKKLNIESPTFKKALQFFEKTAEDIQLKHYDDFKQSEAEIKIDQLDPKYEYKVQLNHILNYLKHVTSQYKLIKKVLKQKNLIKKQDTNFQKSESLQNLYNNQNKDRNLYEQIETQQSNYQAANFSRKTIAFSFEKLQDIQQQEKEKHQAIMKRTDSQTDKLIQVQQNSSKLIKQISINTKKCEKNKQKLMKQRQKDIQYNCLYKVEMAQQKFIHLERQQSLEQDSMRKQYDQESKEIAMTQNDSLEKSKISLNNKKLDRISKFTKQEDKKIKEIHDDFNERILMLEQLDKSQNQIALRKLQNCKDYKQKLKYYNSQNLQTYEKAQNILEDDKNRLQGKVYNQLKQKKAGQQKLKKYLQEQQTSKKNKQLYYQEKTMDINETRNKDFQVKLKSLESNKKADIIKKQENHIKFIDERKQKLQKLDKKKLQKLLFNQTEIQSCSNKKVNNLDAKFEKIGVNLSSFITDQEILINTKLDNRTELIKYKKKKEILLEKGYQNNLCI